MSSTAGKLQALHDFFSSPYWDNSIVHDLFEKAKPSCPVTYRALTLDEFRNIFKADPRVEWWFENAGKTLVEDPMPQVRPDPGFKAMLCDGESIHMAENLMVIETLHSFVQTGMRKSWCGVCNAEGYFDFDSGEFKPT